ncbi:TPA: head-tail joining protein [Burkholderia contaminans]|uniref:head-tail joining protein n=1 Tax=Burkholderia contaminans TaxID=488447 RepID=UPI000CFE3BDD|nr:hypothetical protein [Burkholderia contaminans]HDR9065482.1 hypothetical protein [Burkholderia vietnamiensis]MBM6427921.1 hypothetical protein [Burkholderia contaminans]MCA7876752.1 hypothetical protein [Burkholderia contaminans]MDN8024225.1 hypothetical protein [Burkholderia contaminans]PRG14369.1 hypothetical protein C6Q17_08865 [Burkholderia contaminans]
MIDFDALANGPVAAAFGEALTYQPASGAAYPITGVFAEPYRRQEFDGDGSAVWVTVAPSVGFQLSQLKAPVTKNDRVTRLKTGHSYVITEPQPNGLGWLNLKLKEVS